MCPASTRAGHTAVTIQSETTEPSIAMSKAEQTTPYRAPRQLGGRRRAPGARARNRNAMIFMFPALLILGAFVGFPMVRALGMSFTDTSGFGASSWVGLSNYVQVFTDPDIFDTVVNTAWYVILFTPAAVGFALFLALALTSKHMPFRAFFRTVLFLPFVVSLAVGAFAWSYLLDPNVGLLNYWLSTVGIQLGDVLNDPHLAMPAVALVAVWKNFGFYMVIFIAGLNTIPGELYEAARVDGASAWAQFRHVTVPMLSNTFLFVFVFAMIAALQTFDQIYVMTGGGPYGETQTVVMEIYNSGFRRLELGFASALSYVLLLATLALSLIQLKFFSGKETEL